VSGLTISQRLIWVADYLLDTNAVTDILDGNAAIEKLLNNAANVYLPIIVAGEMYFGAERSGRVEMNRKRVETFISQRKILFCDLETARWHGRISNQLRAKGRPIPQNDMWIAAIAQQYGLTVLTRDEHFNEVNGLLVQSW
jgi:tRNA(fMet)-specific endonuclease VapC